MQALIYGAAVAGGGAIGAVLRFAVTGFFRHRMAWPAWSGTLIVNLLGCLLIGMLWPILEARGVREPVRLFIVTGCLGAFTTFSAFGFDFSELLDGRRWMLATVYVCGSVVVGLGLLRLGLVLGTKLQ